MRYRSGKIVIFDLEKAPIAGPFGVSESGGETPDSTIHHLGFVVEDKQAAAERVVENGGRTGDGKCWDPDGIIVNV